MKVITAGESHGKGLVAVIEGLPSNLCVDVEQINAQLKRRQQGYGRGGRMKIESDAVEVLSGLRGGLTLASPLTLFIKNRDFENWVKVMGAEECDPSLRKVTCVRPGHADFVGCEKYGFTDARNVLERSSARETAARVAAGAVARQFLSQLGVEIRSEVVNFAGICNEASFESALLAEKSPVRVSDAEKEKEIIAAIDRAKEAGDTLGGAFTVFVRGMKRGIGSYVHYDRKLDAFLAFDLMSIQGIKGVEFGLGFGYADVCGSNAHDAMFLNEGGVYRTTNRAGGIEGGMSNGEDIVITCVHKPIPTLMNGLATFDIETKQAARADNERSDVTAVPAAAVVAENVVAITLATEILKALGEGSFETILKRWNELE